MPFAVHWYNIKVNWYTSLHTYLGLFGLNTTLIMIKKMTSFYEAYACITVYITLIFRVWEMLAISVLHYLLGGFTLLAASRVINFCTSYLYKRKKSRSADLSLNELPPVPSKLTPSLRLKIISDIKEDLKEIKVEMTLVERSRVKARNVNDERSRRWHRRWHHWEKESEHLKTRLH